MLPLRGASADKRAVRCQRGHHPDAGAAVLGGWYVAADKFDFQRAAKIQPRTAYQGRFADDDPAYDSDPDYAAGVDDAMDELDW